MAFRITGDVHEKESGLGVPGLMIRAYDKDLLHDDLLGTAVSDEEGHFEMVYTERDFQELFDRRPDIYLSVFLPPGRFLLDTEDAVRWGASEREHFNLVIPRELLGDHSPTRPDDEVAGGISFLPGRLEIRKRGEFDLPALPGFSLGGAPGAPALPQQVQLVALPLGGDVLSLEVRAGEPVKLAGEVNPMPVQSPIPDLGTDPEQFGDGFSADTVRIGFTPADAKYFASKVYPERLAELEETIEYGPLQFASVRVRPVQYVPSRKCFVFYPNLRYVLKFDWGKARKCAEGRVKLKTEMGEYHAELVRLLLDQKLVFSAKDLLLPDRFRLEEVPHVIITDNYEWPESVAVGDGTTRAPGIEERGAARSGDLLAEFERLAKWKTSRGVRSRVVSVSEIVDGAFGDHTQGGFARDLQEVIRNFIKYAQENWDTLYVLLGGDVNVIPMRRLVGSSTYFTVGCVRAPDNPPDEGQCHFLSGRHTVKIRPAFTPQATDPLSSYHRGLLIPYNRNASSGLPGWYHTTEDDFLNKDEDFTKLAPDEPSPYVIVEGPGMLIDDDYYWFREVNSIPSDLYYASLLGPAYSSPGKHDFDDNDNGLYGQFHWDPAVERELSLDGVDFTSEVWVGRAPVDTAAQARAVVDKILTYEQLTTPTGASVDATYLRNILYAAAYWGRAWQHRQTDTSLPPEAGEFTHVGGTTVTKIHTDFDVTRTDGTLSHRLVARTTPVNWVVDYDTLASATNLGWFFCTDETYTSQSLAPTRFIKVSGPEQEVDPQEFFWDPVGLELATDEKEQLRSMMSGYFSSFESVERHYEDYFDLSPPPPLVPLESATVRAAIDRGIHLLSMTGHGDPGGCCSVSHDHDFSNTHQYFIAFADSCSTARPDGNDDSLGEKCVYHPDSGAIAYVGNTRYSWIGVGDNYEQFFWHKLSICGRLGPAAGLRLATGGQRLIWTIYAQNLYGDPEMPVFTEVPKQYDVSYPASASWGGTVYVTVRHLGVPRVGHRVTLMGGWSNSSGRPAVFLTKTTNRFGHASFRLPSDGNAPEDVDITVSHSNFQPFTATIPIVP